MRLFDLHCDTITRCIKKSESLLNTSGHLDLVRGAEYDRWGQVFAIFVPDTLHGEAAATYANRALDYYNSQKREVKRVCAPVLALENGTALGGDFNRLDKFAARGIRIITLTWNGANELGFGAHCEPDRGLTRFGKAVVQRMFELGMIPDVSHLNEAGFWDVAALAHENKKPFWASHSNCDAVARHCRNLNDEQLRAVFNSGGLVGVNLFTEFLGGGGTARDVARHLEHIISLGGEDHAALGSDFDGCDIHPTLAGIETLGNLNDALEDYGFTAMQREKFFWNNAAAYFRDRGKKFLS